MTPQNSSTARTQRHMRTVGVPSPQTRATPGGAAARAPYRSGEHLRLVQHEPARRTPPILLVGALIVVLTLFGLAAFHNVMATAQYKLEKLERELGLEQARLVDLEFQVEELNSPAKVELLARGALGMIDPGEPVDVVVSAELLAEVQIAANGQKSGLSVNTDWVTLRPLLGAS